MRQQVSHEEEVTSDCGCLGLSSDEEKPEVRWRMRRCQKLKLMVLIAKLGYAATSSRACTGCMESGVAAAQHMLSRRPAAHRETCFLPDQDALC